eukprot:TRINITY_DN1566_c0_g3_i1.p1 TRINITY_DN1566_c0_g3~~TRINITY_DN1566_c0_g3_i1.p1  ORF type:complete len:1648 (+),score=694.23 TRINITY_DN1566_c0_g3_i1:250-4944(+)
MQRAHDMDLTLFRKAVAKVLQRSPILQCTVLPKPANAARRGAAAAAAAPPPCDLLAPPYSSKYVLVRPQWDDARVNRFVHVETVDADVCDMTAARVKHLLAPFAFEEDAPLVRFVLLRRGASVREVVVVGHRCVVDAWSVEWIIQELFTFYEQLLTPHGGKLLDLAAQLQRSAAAHAHAVAAPAAAAAAPSSVFQKAVGFWAKNLSDAMPVVQVPVDRPRPQHVSMMQARATYVFPADDAALQALRRYSADKVGGIHAVLCTAFVAWLMRMTAEKDIVIGLLTQLRRQGFEATVGPLTNRLPLRTDLTGTDAQPHGIPFAEAVERVGANMEAVWQHRHVDFEQVVESPQMAATLNAIGKTGLVGGSMQDQDANALAPLFKVMYMMGGELTPTASGSNGSSWASVESTDVVGKAVAPYDLTLRANPTWDGGLELVFLYNEQLFTKPYIAELLNHYAYLVRQAVADPSKPVYEYSLVTPTARAVLPNPTAPQDHGWPGSVPAAFSRCARAHPDRLAVAFEGGATLSYAALDAATSQFARFLLGQGVGKGDVIGIYGHRSPSVVVAILGIYKAGAAYSMMDPCYPGERVVTCMGIAGVTGWVRCDGADPPGAEVQQWLDARGLKVDAVVPQPGSAAFQAAMGAFPESYPEVEVGPEDTAVVTFTSGSTGTPKGVMGKHSSLTTFYPWMGETFGVNGEDRFGMCSGIAHDPLQRDIFTPLFFGAGVYIPTQETISTPGRLGQYLRAHGITVCCFTPALGQILTTVDEEGFEMPALRLAMFVGDMLIKRDVLRLQSMAPHCSIMNMWGTTETSRAVAYYEIPPASDPATAALLPTLKEVIPCGWGMKDCQTVLLNPANQLAGVGEAAEVHMRSCHLTKGYIGLDAETKKKFITSPFNPADATDRMYKSGDLGHYLVDGCVECLGRVDDQVKIRGFRIELGEINAKLSRHPNAKENVTVVRKDPAAPPGSEKIIVSYVVPTPGAVPIGVACPYGAPEAERKRLLAEDFRAFLKEKVPHYMVPTAVVILDRMPLTPNAKVNTRALPEPDLGAGAAGQPELALSETEARVLSVWKKYLRSVVRGADDSFFDLGGHSLLATQVTLELNKEFGTELPLPALFATPTLSGMAAAIAAGAEGWTAADRDFAAEAAVPAGIPSAAGRPVAPTHTPQAVFVTGTPGFFATYVVADLLQRTAAAVYCLVRAGTPDAGRARIVAALKGIAAWKEEYATRVIPVIGDLSKPKLGIDDGLWDTLAARVNFVVHSGAVVHWLYTYEQLKDANVVGTQEVVRLCTAGAQVKTLVFISTTNVYDAEYPHASRIYENNGLTHSKGLSGGYTQSKWVADKLVMNAGAELALPTVIMRPSFISGDAHSGAWTTDDFLVRLMKGCVQLGACPIVAPEKGIDMSPVDWMASGTVTIALAAAQHEGKGFNLVNPTPVPYAALFQHLIDAGYDVAAIPYPEWRGKLLAALSNNDDNALAPIASHFHEDWAVGLRAGQVHDSASLQAAVQGTRQAAFPDMDAAVKQALCYLVGSGFLAPPPGGLTIKENVPWSSLFASGEVALLTRQRQSNKQ